MKKKQKAVLTAVVAAGVLGANQAVQADEVVQPEVAAVQATEQVVDQAALTAATEQLQEANQAVAHQETVTNLAQTAVDIATAQVKEETAKLAGAEKVAQAATPEVVQAAEQAVQSQKEALQANQEEMVKAQDEESQAKTEVSTQFAKTAQAQMAVNEQESVVKAAQADVAGKQAALDTTASKEALDRVAQAEKSLAAAKAAVQKAGSNLEAAKQADTKRATALTQAEKEVVAAQETVATAQELLEEQTQKAQEAEEEFETTGAGYLYLQGIAENPNEITVNEEYVAALVAYFQDYATASEADRKQMEENLASLSEDLYAQHAYVPHPVDELDTDRYDVNQLPDEVLENLSMFASSLINQVREQFGLHPTAVTTSSRAFAKEVTANALRDHWDTWTQGHNDKGIAEAAATYALAGSGDGVNYYEDWAGTDSVSDLTISELKEAVYNAIVNFFFPTKEAGFENLEWFHATDMLGLFYEQMDEPAQVTYLGLSFSKVGDHAGIHFLLVPDVQLTEDSTNFNTEEEPNVYDTAVLADLLEAEESVYQDLLAKKEAAEGEKDQAQELYDQAEVDLAQAEETRDALQASPLQAPLAQSQLEQAQADLDASKLAVEQAQTALEQLDVDVQTKKAALALAQEDLAAKEATLTQLKQALTAEQAVLAQKTVQAGQAAIQVKDLQAKRDKLKASLAQAEQDVTTLKLAPVQVEALRARLQGLQVDLDMKQAQLKEETVTLAVLKEKQVGAQMAYDQLSQAYQSLLEQERLAALESQKQAIEEAGGSALPVFNAAGQLIAYKDARLSVKKSQPTQMTAQAPSEQQELPATGEENAILTLLSGVALLGLGTSFVKRKK